MEGVGDLEEGGLPALVPYRFHDLVHGGGGARNHHRTRPVDGGDRHVLDTFEEYEDILLGGLEGGHHTALGQRLHQPSARRYQSARVLQGEHTGGVGGADLADGVPGHHIRPHTQRLRQPEQRGLDREQRGLRVRRLVEQRRLSRALLREQHILQRAVQERVQVPAHLIKRGREHREGGGQFAAHADPLRALTGEEERQPALSPDTAHDTRGRLVRRQRPQAAPGVQRSPVPSTTARCSSWARVVASASPT